VSAYRPGQRVRLIHTDDPHTALRPGALGTVTYHGTPGGIEFIEVRWDDGSRLTMLPHAGDQIESAD
jgi:hypothetical protein